MKRSIHPYYLMTTFVVLSCLTAPMTAQARVPDLSKLHDLCDSSAEGTPVASALTPSSPEDIYWSDKFASGGGFDGPGVVYALAEYDGQLIAAGWFHSVDGIAVNNIAAWDGTHWVALGEGIGGGDSFSQVYTLSVWNGLLIAGGHFDTAGGAPARDIAAWDGSAWQPLGNGPIPTPQPYTEVYALAAFGDSLIALAAYNTWDRVPYYLVSCWDGASWTDIATPKCCAQAMCVHEGELILGGYSGIYAWDGSSWRDLDEGPALTENNVSVLRSCNGLLFAGGRFRSASFNSHVRSWDGQDWTWYPIGPSNMFDVIVYRGTVIAAANHSTGVLLYAWNGAHWEIFANGSGFVYALTEFNGELIAAGGFLGIGGSATQVLAAWDDHSWSRLGPQDGPWLVGNYVSDLVEFRETLFVTGRFIANDVENAEDISAWDGSSWEPVGHGSIPELNELVVSKDRLYGFGQFGNPGENGAWVFDGMAWTTLPNPPLWPGVADAIDFDGHVLVCGPGGGGVGIAEWDGISWQTIASGVNSSVQAMTVHEGNVVAGGYFTEIGGAFADHIAVWSGVAWKQLGLGVNGAVRTLTSYEGQLIAGGDFTTAGGELVGHIASWDGSAWKSLGAGLNGVVKDLAVCGDLIIAVGNFTMAGGLEVNHIAAWDGESWYALGSGLDTAPATVAGYHDRIYVGGALFSAGGHTRALLAEWDATPSEYEVDLMPRQCPNYLPVGDIREIERPSPALAIPPDRHSISFAILGSDRQDVTAIDPTSIRVAGVSPSKISLRDEAGPTPVQESACECAITRRDGYTDLVLSFDVDKVRAALSPWNEGETKSLSFRGHLSGSFPFAAVGEDCVTLVKAVPSIPAGTPTLPGNNRSRLLDVNYPNPFNAATSICFTLSEPGYVHLSIYNVLGQRIATLTDGDQPAGPNAVTWDARGLASGMYFYRLQMNGVVVTRQMTLLR